MWAFKYFIVALCFLTWMSDVQGTTYNQNIINHHFTDTMCYIC